MTQKHNIIKGQNAPHVTRDVRRVCASSLTVETQLKPCSKTLWNLSPPPPPPLPPLLPPPLPTSSDFFL